MPLRAFAPRPADGVMVPVSSPIGEIVTLPTKAGTPTDADIPGGAAANGDIIIDTTASKIWVRIGGVWKATAALT